MASIKILYRKNEGKIGKTAVHHSRKSVCLLEYNATYSFQFWYCMKNETSETYKKLFMNTLQIEILKDMND